MNVEPSDLDVDSGLRLRSLAMLFATIGGAALVLAVIYVFWVEPGIERVRMTRGPIVSRTNGPMFSTPFIMPGIYNPPIASAADAKLDDTAEVVGISVGGRHRAYSLSAMTSIGFKVVNDVIEDVPVSITYCDRCDNVAVFTAGQRGQALDLGMNGLRNGRLQLRFRDAAFDQLTGDNAMIGGPALPLLHFPFDRTHWRAWLEAHPDTDVYTGGYNEEVLPDSAVPGRQSPLIPPPGEK